MTAEISLRPAALSDAELLLQWRNDSDVRQASFDTEVILLRDHLNWLKRSLADSNRRLFIAIQESEPVGTVRADYSEGCWELSWTVDPMARGRGVGKRMVIELASHLQGPIRAKIKEGHTASERIARHAGMVLIDRIDGVLHYLRPK